MKSLVPVVKYTYIPKPSLKIYEVLLIFSLNGTIKTNIVELVAASRKYGYNLMTNGLKHYTFKRETSIFESEYVDFDNYYKESGNRFYDNI